MHRGVTAPSWAGGGHPWEVHELSPRCRGEHALFDFPRVRHGGLRHHLHPALDTPASPLYGPEWCQKGFSLHQQTIMALIIYLQNHTFQRADERTRTADLLQLRVIGQALQGLAGGRKSPISKPVFFLRFAPCCTVLRSRWCQSGVKRRSPRPLVAWSFVLCTPPSATARSTLGCRRTAQKRIHATLHCVVDVEATYPLRGSYADPMPISSIQAAIGNSDVLPCAACG